MPSSYDYQKFGDTQDEAQRSSNSKSFFSVCAVIAILVLLGFLLFGNGSKECEWDAGNCAVDFVKVGGYCNPYEGYDVKCSDTVYSLGKDCYKAFHSCKKAVGRDFGYIPEPYDRNADNYCPCSTEGCC
eukprot:81209_1